MLGFGQVTADALVDDVIRAMHELPVTVFVLPLIYETQGDGDDVEFIRGLPLVRLRTPAVKRPSWTAKRLLDLAVAGVAMVLLAPLLVVLGIAVYVESGSPVLFWQERVGRDGRRFDLVKFRSMRPTEPGAVDHQWTVSGDPRIGPVGRFLRRTSLDELPQLLNVLRGEMSLVGPRPERPEFVAEFAVEHPRYWARHRVPVGLTGLSQVSGLRGDTSIADRVRHDNRYIASWSIWRDLHILVLTFRQLFRRGQH